MPQLVTAKTKTAIKRRKDLVEAHDLLIKRPPPQFYQRAIDLWKAKLKRHGVAKMAAARRLRGGWTNYLRIGRSAAYAGDAGIKVLVKLASSTPNAQARTQVLDLIESIRNMGSQIQVLATFEHLWSDGSAAVSVHHERIGWLEFDVLAKMLPAGVQPRDLFEVRLYTDQRGNVVRHQVPPRAKIIRSKEPSIGDMLEARLPKPPKDWDDEADVARYHNELETWEKKSGLGQREPQAG